MIATAAEPQTASPQIDSRLTAAERTLQECAARARRGSRLTLIVGGVLLALMAGYFIYGYRQIASVMESKTLVGAAEGWIESQIPEVRKAAETEVARSAPIWAASLSKQARSQLPGVREKLETYVLEQIDQTLEQTVSLTEQEFREFLREHRPALEQGFEDLASNPQLAEESLQQLQAAVEKRFQVKMKEGSEDLFATLKLMNSRLAHLKEGKDLTSEEALERQIATMIRRRQLDEADPKSSPANKDSE